MKGSIVWVPSGQRISRGRVYSDKQSYLLAAAGLLVECGGIKTGDSSGKRFLFGQLVSCTKAITCN